MTVSIRRTRPNLSYIFSQLFFIRCLILAPGQRPFWQLVSTSPSNRGWNRRPKKRQDVLGREVDRGVVQQPRIETSQRLAAGEDQVGGVLGLVDDPIIAEAAKPSLVHQRIDLANQAVEDLAPVQMGERIGQLLSGFWDRPGP